MEPILIAEKITKTFAGVQALKNIDLKVNRGEIHCLVGENGCGKSTLIKCISGVYTQDSGYIILNNNRYQKLTTGQAIREGVQVIYQDLSLFLQMSVAENIAIERLRAENRKIVNWNEVYRIATEQLQKIGVELDLDKKISESSMATRQLTAICRALAHDAKILIMDEPTTTLTKKEVTLLLKIVRNLQSNGISIIFVSHKLNEVFSIADVITVLRNGEKIGDFDRNELDEKSLSKHITGREIDYPRYKRTIKNDTPILEVNQLSRNNQFTNISFDLRKGDILGLIGLLGSGRTEIALSLFGLNPTNSGTIRVEGKNLKITSPQAAKANKIAFLPEDRFSQGLFMGRKITENVSATILDRISKRYIIDKKEEDEIAEDCIATLKIRTPSKETIINTLSGGNQQKTVIGKWMETKPSIFIMDSPTVGIDIGSKAEIYQQIHSLATDGMAFILISDEAEEILANCNKVLILQDGSIKTVLDEEDLEKPDARETILDIVGSKEEKNIERV